MARKKTEALLRDQCRHCGGALIYHHCDEKTERWGDMVYRSDKPRWWHLNPVVPDAVPEPEPEIDLDADPALKVLTNLTKLKQVDDSIYTDSQWGFLGAYCPIKEYEEENLRGQPGEPVNYCVVLKGEWPQQFCLNPVQDTELYQCGVHAKKTREKMRERQLAQERREGGDAHNDGKEEVVRRLLENWGLHAEATRWGTWDGKVSLDHEELEALLESFEQEYKVLQKKGKKSA